MSPRGAVFLALACALVLSGIAVYVGHGEPAPHPRVVKRPVRPARRSPSLRDARAPEPLRAPVKPTEPKPTATETKPAPEEMIPADDSSDEGDADLLARIDALAEDGDSDALLATFAREATIVRFEALRRALQIGAPAPRLLALFFLEKDPDARELLAEAVGATGGPDEAIALAQHLGELDPETRIHAAAAVLDVGAHATVPVASLSLAEDALAALAHDREHAGAAARALRSSSDGRAVLARLAAEPDALDEVRRIAAEQ